MDEPTLRTSHLKIQCACGAGAVMTESQVEGVQARGKSPNRLAFRETHDTFRAGRAAFFEDQHELMLERIGGLQRNVQSVVGQVGSRLIENRPLVATDDNDRVPAQGKES